MPDGSSGRVSRAVDLSSTQSGAPSNHYRSQPHSSPIYRAELRSDVIKTSGKAYRLHFGIRGGLPRAIIACRVVLLGHNVRGEDHATFAALPELRIF
jgi:hypothetical protein